MNKKILLLAFHATIFPFLVHYVCSSSTVPLSGSSPAFVATFRSYKSILCFGCSFIFLRFFDHPWLHTIVAEI